MDELRRFVEDLLRAAGCDIGVARATADVFVEADLHGFDFQGLDHLPTVLKEIRAGKVRPEARPAVRAREGSTAIVNARRAPGPIAAVRAADVAIETASRAGCAAVGVVDSNALYMLGYYAERIARSRLIGIVLTTGRALVHPFGGVERVLATNPLAMAVPRPGPHPSSGDGDQLPRRRPRPPGRLSRGDASRRDRRRPGRFPARTLQWSGPGRSR